MREIPIIQRFRGSLLGLAVGDALGASVEGLPPGSFRPLQGMRGGGPYGLAPGHWTDDTAMALCLADSLIQVRGFDPADQMRRYIRWLRTGYLSSTGEAFDVGMTTYEALSRFETTGEPYSGSADLHSAGNGSLMRLAPVVLMYCRSPDLAIHYAGESSRTTHGAREAVDACRYFALLLVSALSGAKKDELLSPDLWQHGSLSPKIEAIARASYKAKTPPAIRGTGYVVHSLEAALWAFYTTKTFRTGCLLAVNLGDDADTTAAIYGQLAGAYYGEKSVPNRWRRRIAMRSRIEDMADWLEHLARETSIGG